MGMETWPHMQSVLNMNTMRTEIFAVSTNIITYERDHLIVKWLLKEYKQWILKYYKLISVLSIYWCIFKKCHIHDMHEVSFGHEQIHFILSLLIKHYGRKWSISLFYDLKSQSIVRLAMQNIVCLGTLESSRKY